MRAWFINLGPPSKVSPEEAAADIAAIWATGPALLVGCEAVAKGSLPKPGKGNAKIRDTSTPGRSNLFAYVKDVDREKFKWSWDDCTYGFPRAIHPHMGEHPPRSILRFPYQGAQIVVAHKPPAWEGAGKARTEHDQRVAWRMNPDKDRDRSRLLFWDSNGMEGARALADEIDARVIGDHIDNAIIRRTKVIEYGYHNSIGGHRFHTDHPSGAFFLRFKLP